MDRWITLNVFWPLLRHRAERNRRVVILMYHSVSHAADPKRPGYYRLNTPPALFRQHLQLLKDEAFTVIDLGDLATLRTRSPGGRFAVITFDDGFRDFDTHAWPALTEYQYPATMFLPTGYISDRGRGTFAGRECLTWAEVRKLRGEGVRFGSHTVSHPRLVELDDEALNRELRDSKAAIEEKLGESIDSFSHPYAFPSADKLYVKRFRCLLDKVGYHIGLTTTLGRVRPGDDLLMLKRLPANGADDPRLFLAKLAGAYDWLAIPQSLHKRVRRPTVASQEH